MQYTIGDIVIFLRDINKTNRYIIIATEKQKLDQNYLESLNGKLNIKNVSKLADTGVEVTAGFKYKVAKCSDRYENGLCVLEGEFLDVLDEDELTR